MQEIKERNAQYAKVYYVKSREKVLERLRRRYKEHKDSVLAHYGRACACCGESGPLFLTVDHIENDGRKHRKGPDTSHHNIYGWLVRKNFPPGFQILCMNCNQGKHRNGGICPHQEGSTITESTV